MLLISAASGFGVWFLFRSAAIQKKWNSILSSCSTFHLSDSLRKFISTSSEDEDDFEEPEDKSERLISLLAFIAEDQARKGWFH